jgi:hypothetical protein
MSVADEFAFSILNLPGVQGREFREVSWQARPRQVFEPQRTFIETILRSAFVPILLQNSFWITVHKFSGPLVRRSNAYATDRAANSATDGSLSSS